VSGTAVEPRLLTNTARLWIELVRDCDRLSCDDRTRQETRRPRLRGRARGVKTAYALLSGLPYRSMDTRYRGFTTGY